MSERYEILFDSGASIGAIVETSARFFEDHRLNDLAIPVRATSEGNPPAAEARFRLALPGAAALRERGAAIASAVAAEPLIGIDDGEQYSTPYAPTEEEFAAIEASGRPDAPYLLALDPDQFDDDLRGLTAPALRKRLSGDNTSSLTALEYLVVQRIMTAFYSDHRFDYYGTDVDNTRWMWLPDSTLGDKTFMGYWNPGKNRVELSMCRTGSKNVRKGAYRTTITAL